MSGPEPDPRRAGEERFSLARWRPVAVDDLIRVGRAHDGGYVISGRCVDATRVLVGMGINDDWSFEEDFQRRNPDIRVIGVDGSVSGAAFDRHATQATLRAAGYFVRLKRWHMLDQMRTAARWRERARAFREFFEQGDRMLYQKFVSDLDDDSHLTWSTLCRLEPLLAADRPVPEVFAKVDIEGDEYRVLGDMLADAGRINGLVVEFHDCDLWERFTELMDLAQDRFAVVHVHGNNWSSLIPGTNVPKTLEVSLVNRVLLATPISPSTARYPVPGLDMPNHPERLDYPLTF
jgi:hypothetical protein